MKKYALLVLLLITSYTSQSQELETILIAAEDASKLTQNYINPVMKGLMYSMNGGWYTTAKTHKKFGFDITINANASFVPNADQIFAFIPSDYQFLSLPNGETSLPTVMSENDTETTVDIRIPIGNDEFRVGSFDMPGGITNDLPINAIPTPMVQVGLGLPFKTDIKLRLVPNLNFDDNVEANLFGLGLQHNVLQYFGPLEKLPLSVSVLAAFTSMNVSYNIEDDNATDNVAVTNGQAEFKMNTWTVQAIASLDFKIITFYGSLGYNNGSSSIKMKGDYDITYDVEDLAGNPLPQQTVLVRNPINLDFDANGVRATIGTRLNLGPFKIFGDYTLQEYNTATLGIALSFR
jgi:Family of unknown function (DUF6588)